MWVLNGVFRVCFYVRNGLGLAEKWTSVSPWRTGVFKPPSSQKTRPISLMSPLDMTGTNPVSLRDTLL